MLREPELPTGSPDVVVVYSRAGRCHRRQTLPQKHLRVLHQLWVSGGTEEGELASMLSLGPRRLRSIVFELEEAGVIQRRDTFLATRSLESIFRPRQIVAIEAKISDWRGAFRQAHANLWFASESYVLLPKRRALEAPVECAMRWGIGLLMWDGARVRRVVRPQRYPIPSSYGSWLFSEWLNEKEGA